jgi:hypothetical protein
MKNNLLKYFIAVVFFCSTLTAFAQAGPSEGTEEGIEDTSGDTTGAPIDDYVWVLAAIGLIYVFLRVRAFAQQENIPQE